MRDRFDIAPGAEITLEANPGPDERGDPAAWRRAGITRISFGAQSLDDAELRRLGRRHRATDVAAAVEGAREAGIASDQAWISSTTCRTAALATWTATLAAALELAPDHLSLYALTLDDPDAEGLTGPGGDHLPTTRGARRWRERARLAQDEDRAASQYQHAPPFSRMPGSAATRSRIGRVPATRVATTSPTGSAVPTKPSGRARMPSMVPSVAGTRPGWRGTWLP